MVSSSAAELQAKIDAIDVQLDTLIAAPDKFVSYNEAGRAISKRDKLSGLLALREHFVKLLGGIPSETIEDYDVIISPEGEDQTDYIAPDVT